MTRVAGIDCGTNSIRLLIADVDGDRLTDVSRRMEIVRLGQGVDRTGRLAPESIERTRNALADYTAAIKQHGAERIRMVATSATRDAANADDFRVMVKETLGVEPEVVTGDEEAHLSFIGAVRGLPADARPPYLVVDIGGGSTEFVVGAGDVDRAISVNIGCVRMTERHLHSDPPTPTEVAAASADIAAHVDRALSAVGARAAATTGRDAATTARDAATTARDAATTARDAATTARDAATTGRDAATLVGLAGSVTTVAAIALGLAEYDSARIHHARIGYDEVAAVTGRLLAMTTAERLAIPVMHPGRADVIGAGALVLRTIMERSGAGDVIASEHDILDGIAWSLIEMRETP